MYLQCTEFFIFQFNLCVFEWNFWIGKKYSRMYRQTNIVVTYKSPLVKKFFYHGMKLLHDTIWWMHVHAWKIRSNIVIEKSETYLYHTAKISRDMQHKLCTTGGLLITVRFGFVWTVRAVWIIIFQLQYAVTRIVVYSWWYRRFCSFFYFVYDVLASNDSVINIRQSCFFTSATVIVHRLSVEIFSIFCN